MVDALGGSCFHGGVENSYHSLDLKVTPFLLRSILDELFLPFVPLLGIILFTSCGCLNHLVPTPNSFSTPTRGRHSALCMAQNQRCPHFLCLRQADGQGLRGVFSKVLVTGNFPFDDFWRACNWGEISFCLLSIP